MNSTYTIDIYPEEVEADEIGNEVLMGYEGYLSEDETIDPEKLPIKREDFPAAWEAFGYYEAPRDMVRNMINMTRFKIFVIKNQLQDNSSEMTDEPDIKLLKLYESLLNGEISLEEAQKNYLENKD